MEYYQAVAPVIAVIFLALTIEARTVDRDGGDSSGRPSPYSAVTTSILLVLLATGELAALFSLAEGRDTDIAKAFTAIAVVCGGAGVIAPLWKRQWEATRGADLSTWLDAVILFVAVGGAVATVLAFQAG